MFVTVQHDDVLGPKLETDDGAVGLTPLMEPTLDQTSGQQGQEMGLRTSRMLCSTVAGGDFRGLVRAEGRVESLSADD